MVDYTYYEAKYLLGREVKIPSSAFPFWEREALFILGKYVNLKEFEDITAEEEEVIKLCVCALAERGYDYDKATSETEVNIASEKDGTWSVGYRTQAELSVMKDGDMYGIIEKYLGDSRFLSAWVYA